MFSRHLKKKKNKENRATFFCRCCSPSTPFLHLLLWWMRLQSCCPCCTCCCLLWCVLFLGQWVTEQPATQESSQVRRLWDIIAQTKVSAARRLRALAHPFTMMDSSLHREHHKAPICGDWTAFIFYSQSSNGLNTFPSKWITADRRRIAAQLISRPDQNEEWTDFKCRLLNKEINNTV